MEDVKRVQGAAKQIRPWQCYLLSPWRPERKDRIGLFAKEPDTQRQGQGGMNSERKTKRGAHILEAHVLAGPQAELKLGRYICY